MSNIKQFLIRAFFCGILLVSSSIAAISQIFLTMKNRPVCEVIKEIEKVSDYRFFYNDELSDLNKIISVDIKNGNIKDVMEQIAQQAAVSYILKAKHQVVLSLPTVSQQKNVLKITGKVIDDQGEGVIGANVMEKGTTNGTITDIEGEFSLAVSDKSILQISYIGFNTQEIPVNGQRTFTIRMTEDTQFLDEVVVIGYGKTVRTNLAGAVSNIKSDALKDMPGLRVDQMLQGKAAGVMVTQLNGSPGAASSIRIRGNNSITASSEPLYVVDGLLGAGDLSTINPADIADISILKDASATSIYGSRGANGVVLITTKKGTVGTAKINVNIQQGWQWLPRKIDLLSGSQYAQLLNDSRVEAGGIPIYDNPAQVQTTDWQDETMQIAPTTNINLSTNGGNEKVRYYISGSYYDQEGIIKETGVERLQLRANLESRFNEKVKVGVDLNAGRIKIDNNTIPMEPSFNILTTAPSMAVYNQDGMYNYTYPHPQFNGRFNTPVALQFLKTSRNTSGNLTVNAYAEYTPLDWITLKSTFGGVLLNFNRNNNYTDSKLPGQTTNQQFGTAGISYNEGTNYQNENTVTFLKQISRDHFIDGVVGLTFQGGVGETVSASALEFRSDIAQWNNLAAGNPLTRSISSGYENWSMISFLARATYKYKDRYLLTATVREDGSSRLGIGNKWATFPSVALGWVVSKESFIKNLNVFSFLKIRGSYGSVGNQSVGIYQTLSVLTPINTIINGNKVNAWVPGLVSGNTSVVGNPNLKWEIKDQLDLGLEMNFLNDKLKFSLDYYNSTTRNLLLLQEIPSQTGYTQQMSNVGEVRNRGLDMTISSLNIDLPDFQWTTQFTLSHNKNKVLRLGDNNADVVTHTYTYGVKPIGILRVGEPVGSFLTYVSDGIWKEAQGQESIMPGAKAGSVRYKDVDNNGIIDQSDCVISGSGSPSWFGGLGNTFSYKGFGLNIFFSAAFGAKIFNGNAPFLRSSDAQYNHYPEVMDRWDPVTNPDSNVPGALNLDRETYPSDRWIFNASYIRLETLSLSYQIPFSGLMKKYIQSATVNVTGTNLFCISPYNKWGFDPVVNQKGGTDLGYNNSLQGFDYGAYPKAATITCGVNLVF